MRLTCYACRRHVGRSLVSASEAFIIRSAEHKGRDKLQADLGWLYLNFTFFHILRRTDVPQRSSTLLPFDLL
jgi:hypothetical protein